MATGKEIAGILLEPARTFVVPQSLIKLSLFAPLTSFYIEQRKCKHLSGAIVPCSSLCDVHKTAFSAAASGWLGLYLAVSTPSKPSPGSA